MDFDMAGHFDFSLVDIAHRAIGRAIKRALHEPHIVKKLFDRLAIDDGRGKAIAGDSNRRAATLGMQ